MSLPPKILIVDDDIFILEILLTLFEEQEGVHAVACRGGAESLEKVKSFHPDLMIVDLVMPDMDGWEAIRELHRVLEAPVPTIILSGARNESPEDFLNEAGVAGFIAKPFQPDTIISEIEKLMEKA